MLVHKATSAAVENFTDEEPGHFGLHLKPKQSLDDPSEARTSSGLRPDDPFEEYADPSPIKKEEETVHQTRPVPQKRTVTIGQEITQFHKQKKQQFISWLRRVTNENICIFSPQAKNRTLTAELPTKFIVIKDCLYSIAKDEELHLSLKYKHGDCNCLEYWDGENDPYPKGCTLYCCISIKE
jgi:hypothetical protein